MARLRTLSSAFALGLTVLVASSPALADDPPPSGGVDGIGTAEDPNIADDTSINDDPSKADAVTAEDETSSDTGVTKKPRITKATYPVEINHRPMTLPQYTAEISLDAPIVFGGEAETDPGLRATQVLRAGYGVTHDIQVGVSYGFGLQLFDPPEGAKSFEAGKAFSVDVAYTILPDHLAVSVSLPFYADPFASSVTIGAPFRFKMGDKLAIVGGQDLIEIGFNKWPVRVADPEFNLGQAYLDQNPGQAQVSSGAINLQFGAVVELKPNLALSGTTRLHFEDFNGDDLPVPLFFGLTWSKWNLDLGGRLGFVRLDETKSFAVALSAAYRL